MLDRSLTRVYTKFKLSFYRKIFSRYENREEKLTALESICIEVIYALDHPTINEFARFIRISQPNATYRVARLIEKGYLKKVQSQADKREHLLVVTEKYFERYSNSTKYITDVALRMQNHFSEEELAILSRMVEVIDEELMPEIQLKTQEEIDERILPPEVYEALWHDRNQNAEQPD